MRRQRPIPVENHDDTTTNATFYPLFAAAVNGEYPVWASSTKFTFNPSTGVLGGVSVASAATLTTPRAIYGNNFDGSAALTQVIASTYGGTGNGFTKFTGPTTSEKTFTLPDASSTLLYSGGALGTPSGGTVTNLTGTASININGTVGATTPTTVAGTTGSFKGVLRVFDGTGTHYGGVMTQVNGAVISYGVNTDSNNYFGGSYTSADQGGMWTLDTRSGQPLVRLIARAAGSTGAAADIFTLTSAGAATFGSTVGLKGYTVGTLPGGTVGDTAYCTDLLAPAFLVAAVGGGAVVGPVFRNATVWVAF